MRKASSSRTGLKTPTLWTFQKPGRFTPEGHPQICRLQLTEPPTIATVAGEFWQLRLTRLEDTHTDTTYKILTVINKAVHGGEVMNSGPVIKIGTVIPQTSHNQGDRVYLLPAPLEPNSSNKENIFRAKLASCHYALLDQTKVHYATSCNS